MGLKQFPVVLRIWSMSLKMLRHLLPRIDAYRVNMIETTWWLSHSVHMIAILYLLLHMIAVHIISCSTSEIVMSGMSKDESLYNGRSGWIGLSISISLLAMLAKFWFSVSAISSFFVSRVWLIIISFTRIGSFALPDKVFKICQSFFGFLRFSVRDDLKWICLAFLME